MTIDGEMTAPVEGLAARSGAGDAARRRSGRAAGVD